MEILVISSNKEWSSLCLRIWLTKWNSALFEELSFDKASLTLESITTINGSDVYKVKVDTNGEISHRYYNTETGLLVRTESTTEARGQQITEVTDYDKYSPVNGVQFPYHFTQKAGPQTIIFNATNIKVNEGVTAEDFN